MVQFHGGGFRVSMSHIRGDNAVAVQILAGDAFQHGLGLSRMTLLLFSMAR